MKLALAKPQPSQAGRSGSVREATNSSAMERKTMGFLSSFSRWISDDAERRLGPQVLYIVGASGGHSIFACGAHVVSKGLALRPWVEATQRRRLVSQALSQGVPLSCLFCSMEEN